MAISAEEDDIPGHLRHNAGTKNSDAAVARAMILYARRFLRIGFGTAFFLGASQKFILAQCVCLNPNLEAVQGIPNDSSRRSS